jgi:hypothetical protein
MEAMVRHRPSREVGLQIHGLFPLGHGIDCNVVAATVDARLGRRQERHCQACDRAVFGEQFLEYGSRPLDTDAALVEAFADLT